MPINTYAWNIIPDVKVIPLLVSATLILLAWLRVLVTVWGFDWTQLSLWLSSLFVPTLAISALFFGAPGSGYGSRSSVRHLGCRQWLHLFSYQSAMLDNTSSDTGGSSTSKTRRGSGPLGPLILHTIINVGFPTTFFVVNLIFINHKRMLPLL